MAASEVANGSSELKTRISQAKRLKAKAGIPKSCQAGCKAKSRKGEVGRDTLGAARVPRAFDGLNRISDVLSILASHNTTLPLRKEATRLVESTGGLQSLKVLLLGGAQLLPLDLCELPFSAKFLQICSDVGDCACVWAFRWALKRSTAS
jgi:hypothetical protein